MRFTKTLTATAAALLATVALPACAQPAPQAAPAATTDADPALWVVKDADTTIYLFGTVHVLKPGLSWFDEAVKTAFDSSGELVLEMVQPDQATMQGLVTSKGTNPAGALPLTQQLPEAKRAAYTAALTGLGIPATALDQYKPWFAAVNLSLIPIMKAGYTPGSGAESVLSAEAKKANKPVSGLETAEQQLGFFDALSQPAQLAYLSSTVEELPKVPETMERMVGTWSKGDPAALGAIMNETLDDSPEVAKVLLFDRNARWADWIGQRLAKPGTVFIAVGAGHLAGKQSVQDYLAAKKLTATRVTY
jgi:hypothetical protein